MSQANQRSQGENVISIKEKGKALVFLSEKREFALLTVTFELVTTFADFTQTFAYLLYNFTFIIHERINIVLVCSS